jgi:hypothetical protein
MKSYNEIVKIVESNPSQDDIMKMSMDDSSKIVAYHLLGLTDLASEIAKGLEKSERKEALISFSQTKAEPLFLDSDLDTAFSMYKEGRSDIASKIIEIAQEKLDQKEYVNKFSELTGIKEFSGDFELKDQKFSVEDESANLIHLFKVSTQVDQDDEGIQFLVDNADENQVVFAVAKLDNGSFKVQLKDKISESPSVRKVIEKKLTNFLVAAKELYQDQEFSEKIASYTAAAAVITALLGTGISYGHLMTKINDGSFSNNVKSLVPHIDNHVSVQHKMME